MQLVWRCRNLVDSLGRSAAAEAGTRGALVALAGPLRRAYTANLAALAATAEALRDQGLTTERRSRQTEAVEKCRSHGDRLLELMSRLQAADSTGDAAGVDQAVRDLDDFLPAPWSLTASPPISPPMPSVVAIPPKPPSVIREMARPAAGLPTYPARATSAQDYSPADLLETTDVRFTDEIVALAAQLGHSPAKLYEYVRNQVEFECYLGSRKGSGQTLEHRRGNDCDQASLLIALLRCSGIPARYAQGRVKITGEALDRWLGFQNRYSATVMLNTQGFDVALYGSPDSITAIALDRVWVEAYVPYLNYRGAVNDSTGRSWVPMDPVLKDHTSNQPFYVYPDLDLDAEQFVEDYIATVRSTTPVQMLEQQMLSALAESHPGATYDDMVWNRTIVPESDGILPGTLPFELLSYGGAFSAIPWSLRYSVTIRIGWWLFDDLSYTVSLPELAGKQVTVSYAGATPADQQQIDAAGGIWFMPDPAAVSMVPVLKVDGCEIARGTLARMPGTYEFFDLDFLPPMGAPAVRTSVGNSLLVGNSCGLGFDPEDVRPDMLEPQTTCSEEYLGQALHQTALTYLHGAHAASDSLAAMMHLALSNDVAEAIVSNTVTVWVDWSNNPVELEWTGLVVDVDRYVMGAYPLHGDSLLCDFYRVSGADLSVQEDRLFETLFGVPAVSAAKIIGLAHDQGIAVCKITHDVPTDCPEMSQYSEVVTAINQALAAGREVIVPQTALAYYDWVGTGWIEVNPATCGAAYVILGGLNGGATASRWPGSDPTHPDSTHPPPPNRVQCKEVTGEITVDPPGDYYSADDTRHLTFTLHGVKYMGKADDGSGCHELQTLDEQRTLPQSIKEMGPGEHTFEWGQNGECANCGTKQKTLTVVKLTSQTKSPIPPTRDRTTLGIGEEVRCILTPTAATPVAWTLSGPGHLSPSGSEATFSASMSPSTATVHASVSGAECAITFTVLAPSTFLVLSHSDQFLGSPGNNFSGARTVFRCRVLPTTVSFYNVFFRENIGGYTIQWPDGTPTIVEPRLWPYRIDYDNTVYDTITATKRPVSWLFDGSTYRDCNYTVIIHEEYQAADGTWLSPCSESHPNQYRGADLKARVGLEVSTPEYGAWMGPWQ